MKKGNVLLDDGHDVRRTSTSDRRERSGKEPCEDLVGIRVGFEELERRRRNVLII